MDNERTAVSKSENVLVLIPCLNEEGRIGRVVLSVKEMLPSADIVVINDASSDGSAVEARMAGAVVLSHSCTLGYGAALETGYIHAVRYGYEIVLQMDGDGQHLANQLPALIDPLRDGSADIVLGSRYKDKSGVSRRSEAKTDAISIPRLKRLGHKIFSFMIRALTGLQLSDPTSGFQGLNKRALTLFSSGVFPCDYPDSDVILMALMSGLRIREVPIQMRERTGGESMHTGLEPVYYGMKMLLSMFIVLLNFQIWHRWRNEHVSVEVASME